MGAPRVVPAGPAALAALHPNVANVVAREVAAESPVPPGNPLDRVGRGGQEKSKENGGLHHDWSLWASEN